MDLEEFITVDSFECEHASSPFTLITSGMGPCISIGAIYKKDKAYSGILAHCPYPSLDGTFNEFLEALQMLRINHKPRIYLAGGCTYFFRKHTDRPLEAAADLVRNCQYVLEQFEHDNFSPFLRKNWMCSASQCARGHSTVLSLELLQGKARWSLMKTKSIGY